MRKVRIDVEHLTRVEGHGRIVLNATDGRVEKVQWQVTEAPRLFESFVRGRPYHQMAQITSRICGICSIGHAMASLKATEAAMGIPVSEQALKLRRLAVHAENMQSHILHVGYLVSPDMLGAGSVIPLVGSHRDAVLAIIRLHRLANVMSDLVCGRTTHPVNLVPGGFARIPSPVQLRGLRREVEEALPSAAAVGEALFDNSDALPDFSRETEYIALASDDEYALYDGTIASTDTGRHPLEEYAEVAGEFVVPHSTAKYTRHHRDSYMVGALARFNLNSGHLSPMARKWASRFGLSAVNTNPFMMNIAQFVEIMHCLEDSMAILDGLLDGGIVNEAAPEVSAKGGRGIGAVDVPRGLLIHDYTYDDEGRCVEANLVIPTNQNHNNIGKDMEALAPTLLDRPDGEIELTLEMLVRAYDPCISCSAHYLDVKWRR